jgi:hypothetical protein
LRDKCIYALNAGSPENVIDLKSDDADCWSAHFLRSPFCSAVAGYSGVRSRIDQA